MDVQQKILSRRGADMVYITFGEGTRPFVLIAGVSLAGISGLGMTVSRAYEPLCRTHRVTLFDRIEPLPDGYTTGDMARDVMDAMDELGIRDADMMGVSQGGMIAQLIAACRPELVHSLVLSSTMCCINETAAASVSRWVELAEQGNVRALNRDFYEKLYPADFLEANRKALQVMERMGTPAQCRRVAILSRAVLAFDSRELLSRIRCPVLVIGDRTDRVLTAEASLELARRLNCPIHLYDGYGHAVYDLAPDFKTRILDFFQSVT